MRKKGKFFQFTKTKVLLTLISFIILFYLVGIPTETQAVCLLTECPQSVTFHQPSFLFTGNLDSIQWAPFTVLVVLEIIISYIISCLIVYLYKKHKRHRK